MVVRDKEQGYEGRGGGRDNTTEIVRIVDEGGSERNEGGLGF